MLTLPKNDVQFIAKPVPLREPHAATTMSTISSPTINGAPAPSSASPIEPRNESIWWPTASMGQKAVAQTLVATVPSQTVEEEEKKNPAICSRDCWRSSRLNHPPSSRFE